MDLTVGGQESLHMTGDAHGAIRRPGGHQGLNRRTTDINGNQVDCSLYGTALEHSPALLSLSQVFGGEFVCVISYFVCFITFCTLYFSIRRVALSDLITHSA